MSKILLIGGCGYVGSNLYAHLVSSGHSVVSVDLEWFGNPGIQNQKVDFSDLEDGFVREFDSVILLAGHSSISMCEDEPSARRNNVRNFLSLSGKLSKDQRLIYASSINTYASCPHRHHLHDEGCGGRAFDSEYNYQKAVVDDLSADLAVPAIGLRFGTVCGSSPNLRTDVVLNSMVRAAASTGRVTVSSPAAWRPILWARDLCRAFEAAIGAPPGARGVYNLASFNETMGCLADEVCLRTGADLVVGRETPTTSIAVSCERFKRDFDFKFEGTVATIVSDLSHALSVVLASNRKDRRSY